MTDITAPPLRVGLVGLGRRGLNLLERFTADSAFQVVAVSENSSVADVVNHFNVRLVDHPEELAAASDIDVLWFSGLGPIDNAQFSREILQRKHVIFETPLALSLEIAERMLECAAQTNRLLMVHHPRRSDPDFRQALTVAHDETLGAVRAVKFVLWSYGLPPRDVSRGLGPLPDYGTDDPRATQTRLTAHALDQLAALIPARPQSVRATVGSDAADFQSSCSLDLQIDFEGGCTAEIDIRLDSPTQYQSGWVLVSERGGYSNGRQFNLTEDGEIFDSPIETVGSDNDTDQFEWLARHIRTGVRNEAEEIRIRKVVSVLDAAQRSLQAKQVITL